MRAIAALAVLNLSLSLSFGCGSGPTQPVFEPRGGRIAVKPLSADGAGSTVALVDLGGARRLAFAADEDDGRIHAFDLDRRTELSTTGLEGTPGQIVITRDGSLFVALKDRARVAHYRISNADGALDLQRELPTAAEPIALALADDDHTLMVASGWGAELAVFDIEAHDAKLRTRVPLAREPRAVIVPRRGRAIVSHASAEPLTVVDFYGINGVYARRLDVNARKHHLAQGFALASVEGKIFAPQVEAEPEPAETYYGTPTMQPIMTTIDEKLEVTALRRAYRSECLLPRAAVVRRAPGTTVLVACMGEDLLLEYDGEMSISIRRWALPGGVTGLAVDPTTDTVVGWAQHSRTLVMTKLEMTTTAVPDGKNYPSSTRIAASGKSKIPEDVRLGRAVFHHSGSHSLSADGRVCASCHPDGRDDGRVWKTPDGPRQTMMLSGRLADTAPYGWTRHENTLQSYVADTIKRLKGNGLDPTNAIALEKYLLWLSVPKLDVPTSPGRVAEGKAIFESREAKCSMCHSGPATTDGLRHDVGSGAASWVDPFETPSLRFISKTAPYLHDGRYATLRALLTANDTKMGSTKHLRPEEIDALQAYLESL